jgi:hypothetical protein
VTDVSLGNGNDVNEALERGRAYASAGASGFFIPGLTASDQIRRMVEELPLPVNVMIMEGVPSNGELAQLGGARVSYGRIPYVESLRALREKAGKLFYEPAKDASSAERLAPSGQGKGSSYLRAVRPRSTFSPGTSPGAGARSYAARENSREIALVAEATNQRDVR